MGLFFKEKPKAEAAIPVEQPQQQSTVPYVAPTYTPQPTTFTTGQFSVPVAAAPTGNDFSVFLDQIQEALEAANMPNTQDYMDLKNSLVNMANLPMDEQTKFKAVFATLQGAGCDLQALIESFDYYKNIVATEKHNFDEAIQQAESEAIVGKQQTVDSLLQQNAKRAEDIKKCTDEINANQAQISSLQSEIAVSKTKIDQKRNDFNAAYTKVVSDIESDLQKVQTYIGPIVSKPATPKKSKK